MTTTHAALAAELRTLMEKATNRPWETRPRDMHGDNIFGADNRRVANTYGDLHLPGNKATQDLIVAAVNALPTLLDAIDAAEARCGRMEEALKSARRCIVDHHNATYAAPQMFGDNGICVLCSDGKTTIFDEINAALAKETNDGA